MLTRNRLFAFAFLAVLCTTAAAPAQQRQPDKAIFKSSPKVLAAFNEVVAKPSLCTVRVKCDGKDVALGTVISADGWILTKFSELKGEPVCKLRDGRQFEAQLVGVHDKSDLALLKIEATGLTPVQFAESKVAPVGNWVASVGMSDEPVAVGVVSVAARNLGGARTPAPNTSSGYIGVGLEPADPGVKVTQVMAGTGAEKAGIKVNDVILSVGSTKVQDLESFMDMMQKSKPGDVLSLKVKRGDKEMDFQVTLGKRPAASRGDFQNSLGSELSNLRTGFPTILQHDSVIKPSDCGGPLVDLDGRIVGINIARAGRTESYAIPSEAILPLLNDLKSGKLAPKLVVDQVLAEKLAAAKAALQKAESDKAAADKKLADARAALESLQSQQKALTPK